MHPLKIRNVAHIHHRSIGWVYKIHRLHLIRDWFVAEVLGIKTLIIYKANRYNTFIRTEIMDKGKKKKKQRKTLCLFRSLYIYIYIYHPNNMSWGLFNLRIYKRILINLPECSMYDNLYVNL